MVDIYCHITRQKMSIVLLVSIQTNTNTPFVQFTQDKKHGKHNNYDVCRAFYFKLSFYYLVVNSNINNIALNTIECPSCKHQCCLSVYAYYCRWLRICSVKVRLRILRVVCSECGRTHAIPPFCIVPNSQIPFVNGTFEAGKSKQDFLRLAASHQYPMPDGSKRVFSPATIERWYYSYLKSGFTALYPVSRLDEGESRKLDSELKQTIAYYISIKQ